MGYFSLAAFVLPQKVTADDAHQRNDGEGEERETTKPRRRANTGEKVNEILIIVVDTLPFVVI